MSIAALLQAAEYLDRREREAEHGYASTLPMPIDNQHQLQQQQQHHQHHNSGGSISGLSTSSSSSSSSRHSKVKKNQGSRSTHNELEKNRRAQLRTCLEKLKELVPLSPESARHTTLGLLTRAKHFIKTLEERDRRHLQVKDQLYREQRFLRRKVDQLSQQYESLHQMQKRRANSLSECSVTSSTTSTASSLSSLASSHSETGIAAFDDEVDVIGYGSHGSDLDDQLSVESASSDSGIGLGTNAMAASNGSGASASASGAGVASIGGHFPNLSITDPSDA